MTEFKIMGTGFLYGREVLLTTYPGTNRIGWVWANNKKPISEEELDYLEKQQERITKNEKT